MEEKNIVFKVEKKSKDYIVMSYYHWEDSNLSFDAKGILTYILTLDDSFKLSINGLSTELKIGENKVIRLLKELKSNRYLESKKIKNGNLVCGCEYTIYEKPYDFCPKSQENDKNLRDLHFRDLENRDTEEKEKVTPKDKRYYKEKYIINNIPKEKALSFDVSGIGKDLIDTLLTYNFDDQLNDVLCEFIRTRKKLKKPLTPYALKININKLNRLASDSESKIKIVNQSIEKGYQGLFPVTSGSYIPKNTNDKKDFQKYEYTEEEYKNKTADLDDILNSIKGDK